jgi:hypothetical protein
VETGQCTANTGSATTTCTTGFQGKAVILFMTGDTTNNGAVNGASFSIGFSDGTNHRSVSFAGDNAVATSNAGKSWRTDGALDYLSNGTPTSTRRVTGVAFNATPNMVLTWDGTPAAAYLVNYILLGGSDITNVAVGTFTSATTGASQSITGVGFQPDFGMFIGAMMTAAGTSAAGAEASLSIGFAKDSTHEFAMAVGIDDAQTMSANVNGVNIVHNDATLAGITLGAQTEDVLADFTSFDSGGATFNFSNLPTSAYQFGYLLIKGGQWDVGTSTKPTTATTQTVTGMAFQPTLAAWLRPTQDTANNTIVSGAVVDFGAATSTSTEVNARSGHNDAINTVADRISQNTKVLSSTTIVSGSEVGLADFTSFNSDGWTITWDNTGLADLIGWFAVANNAAAPTCAGTRLLIGVGC